MFSKHIPFFTVFYEYSPSVLIYYKEAKGQKLKEKKKKNKQTNKINLFFSQNVG